jgi:hypothetical protein
MNEFMKRALFFIGLLLAQIAVTGLIFIFIWVTFFFALIPLLEQKSPAFFIIVILAIVLGGLAIPVVSAIWAYRDAKQFVIQEVEAWTPAGWALAMLFFWFPGLTIYLFLRKFRYNIELQGRNQHNQS